MDMKSGILDMSQETEQIFVTKARRYGNWKKDGLATDPHRNMGQETLDRLTLQGEKSQSERTNKFGLSLWRLSPSSRSIDLGLCCAGMLSDPAIHFFCVCAESVWVCG